MKMIHSTQLLCAATALFFAGSALAAPHPLSGTIAASDDWRIPKSNYGKGPAIQCASKNNPGYLASGTGDSMCGVGYGSVWQCNADKQWTVEDCNARSTADRWCGCTSKTGNRPSGWTGSAGCVFFDKNVVNGVEQTATPSDDVC